MKLSIRSINRVFVILTTIAAWIFFGVLYKYHLLYVEGMQMFLYTKDYLVETCSIPGGFADYASRFLIQFYHYPLIGGFIIALLLVTLQQGVSAVCNQTAECNKFLPLTYVPSLFYWILMCNENYTLAGLTGLIAGVWAAWFYMKIEKSSLRAIYGVLALIVVWLTMGGGAFVTLALIVYAEFSIKGRRSTVALLCIAITATSLIFTAKYIAPQINITALILGGHYFRLPEAPLTTFYCLWASVLLVVIAIRFLPKIKKKWLFTVLMIMTLGTGGYAISKSYLSLYEEVMYYLFETRNRQWEKIISQAEKHEPGSPVATNCVNLALGMTNQLDDKMFDFYQCGTPSLIQDYKDDILFSGEILFNLGFINEAQHYAYESMESISDQQKSVFFITRLAETNLIAGRSEVAMKYLRILKHTLFYRKWAEEILAIAGEDAAGDSTAIGKIPIYAGLRHIQPTENFVYMYKSFDIMLRVMLKQHPDNQLAYNYLMADYLVTKNLDAFSENLVITGKLLGRHYQEALVLISSISRTYPEHLSVSVNNSMQRQMDKFIGSYNTSGGNPGVMAKDFGKTFWFYATFTKLK